MKRSRANSEESDRQVASGHGLLGSLSKQDRKDNVLHQSQIHLPRTAAVESGEQEINHHLSYFCKHLSANMKSTLPATPRLSIAEYSELFQQNQHGKGTHFVIHQHDHPIAGTHYDLRLQINKLSSVSWAVMYGLPGNPNSQRLNRNATETRIHCLWNHLVETASTKTGSMLIWDTGEYEILPYKKPERISDAQSQGSGYQSDSQSEGAAKATESLHDQFQQGKIRIRFHGARLPENYTIALRMAPLHNQSRQSGLNGPVRTRGRGRGRRPLVSSRRPRHSTDEDEPQAMNISAANASDEEADAEMRRNNAYAGSINSIGSIHQRTWYLSLDRESSGFEKKKGPDGTHWERARCGDKVLGFEPFYVRGRDVEKSVITGRRGADVLHDEGIEGYIGRSGWRPVLE